MHAVVQETGVIVVYTSTLQHGRVVVGDGTVAGPLAEERHGKDEHGSVAGLTRVEEFTVVPPTLVGARDADVFDHFFIFELDDGRVAVAFAVEACHGV